MKNKIVVSIVVGALALAGSAIAAAAVTFDAESGEGFVGKGDVQLVFGWNNKQLQDNAESVLFRYQSGESVTWTCVDPTPDEPPFIPSQNRTSTQSIDGDVERETRKNSSGKDGPVTGFILDGWDGEPVVVEDGPALHSCPASRTYLDGSDVVTPLGGGIQVSINGVDWFDVQ